MLPLSWYLLFKIFKMYSPTNSHISAPSKDPMVTSNMLFPFLYPRSASFVEKEWISGMHYNVYFLLWDINELLGIIDCTVQKVGWYRGVEIIYVKYYEGMLAFVWYAFEPFNDWRWIFPLVCLRFVPYTAVYSFNDLLANKSQFTLRRVDHSASWFLYEIDLVVFKGFIALPCIPPCLRFLFLAKSFASWLTVLKSFSPAFLYVVVILLFSSLWYSSLSSL